MIMVIKFIFDFCNFGVIVCFLTKLLTVGILFSTAVNAVFVSKPLTSRILPSISAILASQSVFLTRPPVLGIASSNSDLSVSYLDF